ncbi:hypothetical protein [Peribacillus asahii]|uniref:hypothetical protein n=1 Tax=Peribacillus asahii TaxID=228899 RepID=UPI00382B08D0
MEHLYGITIDPSVKFRSEIENIADKITKKKAAREIFGKSPFITPDKNFFILQPNPTISNQLVVGYNEIPQAAQITLTLRQNESEGNFEHDTEGNFAKVTTLAKDCTEIITSHLDVDISRVGSVHKFVLETTAVKSKILEHFVRDIMTDSGNFHGGIFKFLYREKPLGLPELNINISIETSETNDLMQFEIDINNKDLGSMSVNQIENIGAYSRDFVRNRLFKMLGDKGLI